VLKQPVTPENARLGREMISAQARSHILQYSAQPREGNAGRRRRNEKKAMDETS